MAFIDERSEWEVGSYRYLMKICIVTDTWNQINGVSTTLKNTTECLVDQGHDVRVIHPGEFFTVPMPGYPEVELSVNIWKVGNKIQEYNPDAIHIATEGPLGFAARWYCKVTKRNIPHNTSYHTKFPEYIQEKFRIPVSITYGILRIFHKFSHRVLVTNSSMVSELKHRGFSNLVVWSRGVDHKLFSTELRDDQFRKSLGPGPVVMCVSRVSLEKNLEAFCELNTPGTLVLVGDGPQRKQLEAKYPNVKFLGYKTGEELARYYANADVFVFPSVSDTFGVVMLESISTGTPVAAYPVTGPIDVIEPGITGYMNDNLQYAMEKALLLDRNKVHLASGRWTWNACTDTFLQNLININDQKN